MKIAKFVTFEAPLSFEGVTRSCVKFGKAKGGALRCKKFQKGLKHPKCPGVGLKGGGRSQNYIRGGKKSCGTRGGK
jgi:hypothetical protein